MWVLTVFRSTPACRAMALTDRPWRCKSRITTSSPSLITGSSLPPEGGASAIRRARRPSRACPGRPAVTRTGEISYVTSGENCSATHTGLAHGVAQDLAEIGPHAAQRPGGALELFGVGVALVGDQ